MDSEPKAPPEDPEAYLRQLAQHERWLATYVYSLVAHSHVAEDLLQEVKLTLWRHFAKFEAGTNFRAWARTIALHEVLNFRRSAKRHAGTALEEVFVEAVALELDRQSLALESQSERLGRCLKIWANTPGWTDAGPSPGQTRRVAEFWLLRGGRSGLMSVGGAALTEFCAQIPTGLSAFCSCARRRKRTQADLRMASPPRNIRERGLPRCA